ncbi:MAG: hypothetical protein MJ224_00005 [archaeon]|nr:hypothetical protein [archaeon]
MKLHTIKFTEKEINELFKLVLKYSLSNSLYVKLKKHVKEPELIYDESGTIIGEINDITEDDEKVENRHKFIDESIESNADGVF